MDTGIEPWVRGWTGFLSLSGLTSMSTRRASTSTDPMSQAAPCGRASSRWSSDTSHEPSAALPAASITGLPRPERCVSVRSVPPALS